MQVYIPGYCMPVWIQVIRMPGMVDSLNEILLGLDNSDEMGMVMDRRGGERHTLYYTLPLSGGPVMSPHIPAATLSRQLAGGSRVDHNWAGGATCQRALPALVKEVPNVKKPQFVELGINGQVYNLPIVEASLAAALPPDSRPAAGAKSAFDGSSMDFDSHQLDQQDEDEMLDDLDAPTVEHLEQLVRLGERAVKNGEQTSRAFLQSLPESIWEWQSNPAASLPSPCVNNVEATGAGEAKKGDGASFSFKV